MRFAGIPSSAIAEGGRRLTADYYVPMDPGAAEDLARHRQTSVPLRTLCHDKGIFRGAIFRRIFAVDPPLVALMSPRPTWRKQIFGRRPTFRSATANCSMNWRCIRG